MSNSGAAWIDFLADQERRANLQIGDLVKCPQTWNPAENGYRGNGVSVNDSYVGLVVAVAGYKCVVLGGNRVSWDGIKGRCSWDMSDLTLLETA